ncbi:tRNA (adenosine(37)-N6)-threonylcarbamoyltransferase complex ATPase subunit type 1 TsaE, partial [Patescibacteria group bacterium]|nr:tRNA (adenosine(37)-N6)-threonylcarbamoyltransferase complex ATPase subunit type 1 TsaE [Patescibacteria group bacterium]
MKKSVADPEALSLEAERFACTLTCGGASGATLITLSGELGTGKTSFVKAAAKALGIEEVVNSPTFVLEKIYQLPRKAGHPVSG